MIYLAAVCVRLGNGGRLPAQPKGHSVGLARREISVHGQREPAPSDCPGRAVEVVHAKQHPGMGGPSRESEV
ncbi:Uncharacterised protein [Mycobacteroides abscessus subsp. abscessus]|nr:Uncharacterised protein [Mycobacteroides abscessus subsp. abscessus]